jgi:hypothetical protein
MPTNLNTKIVQTLALLVLTLGLGTGCRGREIVDPPSTFKTLAKQDYNFETVWEVSLEAMRVLKFRVQTKERNGPDRTAVVVSGMRINDIVRLEGEEVAQRLRVEILPSANSSHEIRVAASQWKRGVTVSGGSDLWEFDGTAKDLHAKFEATMEKQFSKRYKGKKD